MKRIVSLILCAVLVMGMLPSIAFAATTVASGTCGDNLTWVLDSDGLLTISGSGPMTDYSFTEAPWNANRYNILNISLPQGLTTIGEHAFVYLTSLTSVTIPDSVITIGDYAFGYCTSMTRVTIPDSVTTIGVQAFYRCESLTSVFIPTSVTTIGDYAFGYCTSMTGIWVSAENRNYSHDSRGCLFDKAKEVFVAAPGSISGSYSIPDSVTTIGTHAFDTCFNLTDIIIPDSVTTIGYYAFSSCENLTSITIPDSVTTIVSYAFDYCTNLIEIHFEGIAPTFGYFVFNKVTATAYYHGSNSSWTSDKRQNYGGTITWQSVSCTRETIPAVAATCTETGLSAGSKCSGCGLVFTAQTVVPALGHDWNAATCSSPKTCKRCYTTSGSALGHDWLDATCTAPKTCSICGETSGSALGHSWSAATCTDPKTCTKCNITSGTALGHSWNAATCTSPKTCSRCSATTGSALGHNYADGICTRCGTPDSGYEPPKPAVDGVTRLAGAGRVETCLEIAVELKERMGVTQFQNVVVASASNFPDALAGSYLAAKMNAPILLTMNKYHGNILGYISANLAPGGTVFILGGTSAVPAAFTDMLTKSNISWERVAGDDRYATNLEILNRAGVTSGQTILVCTGTGFADSLSVSATGLPILLVGKKLTDAQKAFLNRCGGGKIYIIGGTSAVSVSVANELKGYASSVKRLAGAGRHETSVLVANEFFPNAESAVIAYSQNFPDGLSGGPLAYNLGAPLILTTSTDTCVNEFTNLKDIDDGYVLGGDGLIKNAAVRRIFHMSAAAPIN